jgi:RNA 2',3'-cyclic 3'-phosphodiesterase
MMRLFIALEIDEETRAELAEEIALLKRECPRVRWVRPENLHVTVKFLGGVPEPDVPEICRLLAESAAEHAAFTLEIRDLGCFPKIERPRAIWAGCRRGSDEAARLAGTIDQAMHTLGFETERRRYTPHVTLGRVKIPAHARGIGCHIGDAETILFGEVDVDAAALFMSELKRGGAEYTRMARFPLDGGTLQ